MEAIWVGQRAHIRHLLWLHPDWTGQQVAEAVGCSRSMISKWRQRFAEAAPDDVMVLFSHSRAPHHHLPHIDEQIKERVQEIRLNPPEGLQRTPGPVAILYYLQRDQELKATGCLLKRQRKNQSTGEIVITSLLYGLETACDRGCRFLLCLDACLFFADVYFLHF